MNNENSFLHRLRRRLSLAFYILLGYNIVVYNTWNKDLICVIGDTPCCKRRYAAQYLDDSIEVYVKNDVIKVKERRLDD